MDASDEFQFIAAAAGSSSSLTPKKKKTTGNYSNGATAENEPTDSRHVPVCMYNSNKNIKLRFIWDKAFKLFQSHRPVYKAISGINHQDYGTIGPSNISDSLTTSTGLKTKSRSHNHIDWVGLSVESSPNVMNMPVTTKTQASNTVTKKSVTPTKKSGTHHHRLPRRHLTTTVDARTVNSALTIATAGSSSSSSNGSSNNGSKNMMQATVHTGTSCTPSSTRPIAGSKIISGVQKPEGDELAHYYYYSPTATGKRSLVGRSHSIKSHFSDDSLFHLDSTEAPSPFPRTRRANIRASKSVLGKSSCSRPESPFYVEPYNCKRTDSDNTSVNSGGDSGVDTWKSPVVLDSSASNPPSGIVCTISQKIPDHSASEENNSSNTTVVVLNREGTIDDYNQKSSEVEEGEECGFHDVDCMSEIDLNSDEEGDSEKMKCVAPVTATANILNSSGASDNENHNELDSLDLSLFETPREDENGSANEESTLLRRLTKEMMRINNNSNTSDQMYETICSESSNYNNCGASDTTNKENTSTMGSCGRCSNNNGNQQNWDDAGSDFEFVSTVANATPCISNIRV